MKESLISKTVRYHPGFSVRLGSGLGVRLGSGFTVRLGSGFGVRNSPEYALPKHRRLDRTTNMLCASY